MKTKVKIFTGSDDTAYLEKQINDWIEENNITVQSISTAMHNLMGGGRMITILYVDGITAI